MIIKAFSYKKKKYMELVNDRSLFIVGDGMLKFRNLEEENYFSCIVENGQIRIGKSLHNKGNFRVLGNFKHNSVLLYEEIDPTKPILVEFPEKFSLFADIILYSGEGLLEKPYLSKKYSIYSLLGSRGKMLKPVLVGTYPFDDNDQVKLTEDAKEYNWV